MTANPEATDHAEVIRASLDAFQKGRLDSSWDDARAALDALLAERDEAVQSRVDADEAWGREWKKRVAAEASLTRYRNALEQARHWHEQQDYDEALNVIDRVLEDRAALDGPKEAARSGSG